MQTAHLERARRIAFHLSQRHRRGTPECRYWLRLEGAIARELRRLEASGSEPEGARGRPRPGEMPFLTLPLVSGSLDADEPA
jgi:hypothetical protein